MQHKYYEPTEYEQMLIAARWVSIEDLDPDYLEYVKKTREDVQEYETWQSLRREWDRLNTRYMEEVEPFQLDAENFTVQMEALAEDLLAKMSELEYLLGY